MLINKKAFTMIEIVVVISMILLASSILIGSIVGIVKRNQEQKKSDIKDAILAANIIYFSDMGTCPGDVDPTNDPAGIEELKKKNLIQPALISGYTITITGNCEVASSIAVSKT